MSDIFSIRREGFSSAYGVTGGPVEDRAEIASALLTDPAKIEALAKDEPALADKVKKIKAEYLEKSNGLMDETYWNLLSRKDIKGIKSYFALREQGIK